MQMHMKIVRQHTYLYLLTFVLPAFVPDVSTHRKPNGLLSLFSDMSVYVSLSVCLSVT